mmetsp:Transcript_92470/g.233189  ORF Transcript_92470/g.233189 Transcript_92470/m.233189 type:complete len:428 (-) Transcript_92470:64-1347(-)
MLFGFGTTFLVFGLAALERFRGCLGDHLAAAAEGSANPVFFGPGLLGEDDACPASAAHEDDCSLSLRQLRQQRQSRVAEATRHRSSGGVDLEAGIVDLSLDSPWILTKRYDLSKEPKEEFDVIEIPDANLTGSCANYTDDGTTVFTRDGKLVLKVAAECADATCLNSGRVMSKESFKYGIFTWSAKVPKCNRIWPALWLLPGDTTGNGSYGTWPCSGEIDVLESVHDDPWAAFNLVAGYGSKGGADGFCGAEPDCNQCSPPAYCTSTTIQNLNESWYYVEDVDCTADEHPSWKEHTFVHYWQPGTLATWVDPELAYDAQGHLVGITPNTALNGTTTRNITLPSYKVYKQETTPTWTAVSDYMGKCFKETAAPDAPFDIGFKLVLNIAIGGYGGAPCGWGQETCHTVCGGAVGSELVISDISVWEKMA